MGPWGGNSGGLHDHMNPSHPDALVGARGVCEMRTRLVAKSETNGLTSNKGSGNILVQNVLDWPLPGRCAITCPPWRGPPCPRAGRARRVWRGPGGARRCSGAGYSFHQIPRHEGGLCLSCSPSSSPTRGVGPRAVRTWRIWCGPGGARRCSGTGYSLHRIPRHQAGLGPSCSPSFSSIRGAGAVF